MWLGDKTAEERARNRGHRLKGLMSIFGFERLFGHLKKNGFDLEASHITNGVKLEKLFALVVWAFIFSVAWGCHLREQKIKTSAATRRKSLFRLGLESILALIDPWNHANPAHPSPQDFDE